MSYKIPRGCQDLFGAQAAKWQQVEKVLRDFCYLYGFDEIRTPTFEHTEVFSRKNDSSDMVNKEMYTFTAPGSKTSVTLRPEGTAGVVRSYVENKMYASADLPVKLYYIGPMHRHERPQKGRLRIFNQFGVESLGVKSPYADAEVMVLAYSILKALGLSNIRILLNTLGDEESRQAYRKALEEHFKDSIDTLCEDCRRRYEQNPLRILDCKIDHDKECVRNAPRMKDYLTDESKEYFQTVCSLLDEMGIPYQIEDDLVRGLDYYTHTVFEIVSESEGMGAQSTILGGGRYDGLIPYFGGPEQSGIGWAVGLERLMIALEAEGVEMEAPDGVDVYVMALDPEAKNYAFALMTELRANGYRAEMDLMDRSFKAKFKAADRAHAKAVLLVGLTEKEAGTVAIKNTKTREQQTVEAERMVEVIDALFEAAEEAEGHHHHHHEE